MRCHVPVEHDGARAGMVEAAAGVEVVVLPAPLGPISPVILPTEAVSLRSSTATRPPKVTLRSRTSSDFA